MKILKNIYKWCTKTRLRKLLSSTLAILTLLTSIRFLFLKPKEVSANTLINFDEGYGTTVNDTSGTASGTITGATWKTDDLCYSGKCLYFDGSDWISFGDEDTLDFAAATDFTIQFWFRHTQTTTTEVIIQKYEGTGADGGYRIQMESDGDISFGVDDANGSFADDNITSTAATYDDNNWHFVSAVKDGTTGIYLYIDGVQVASDTSIGSTGSLANDDTLYIGDSTGSDSGDEFVGFLDEVKIYTTTARTQAEINADKLGSTPDRGISASFGPDNSWISNGMLGYWKLDESSGNVTDYSGNNNTLTNNGTTTFVGGKFGKGSEHVPASSQYFSVSTSSTSYYFNDATPNDPDIVWGNDANAFDNSIATFASTSNNGSKITNSLNGTGTNAPGTGSNITSVRARIYGYTDSPAVLNATIEYFVDGDLGTATNNETVAGWDTYTTLSTPSGGWTWDKVQNLTVFLFATNSGGLESVNAAIVEIEVQTGSAIVDVKSVSFWTNPDTTTNYYASLTSGAYITSSSGTLSTTGLTNSKIYVNGVESTTIAADQWHLVTVTFDVITADQFYIGRQSSNYYDGTLDEVRLYNRSLSPTEVAKLYTFAPGPMAHWKLDENTGTSSVNDSSGEENSATMTGTMTSNDWVPGKLGSALDFDGSDDALTIATASDTDLDFNGTEAFSAGAWVYVKTMPGSGEQDAIITKWDETSTTRGYRLFVENDDADITGNFQVDIYDESADQTISATGSIDTISVNTWYHVFFTFNGGTAGAAADLNLYTNAVFTNSNSLNASFVGLEDVTADFSVGDYDTTDAVSTNTAFTGIIDNLQIYNYARSQAQIVEDMNGGHPAPGSPVGSATSYWKFDTGYGTTAYDASVNANNLTLSTATSAWTTSGKFNKAWDGNGTRYMSRANDDDFDVGTSDFAFSFWFKSDNSGGSGTQYIINRASSTIQGFAIYGNSSGNIVFAIDDDTTWDPDSTATSTSNLYNQAWHHITAVKTGTSKMELFVDGKLDATNSSITTGSLSNDLTFYIGDRDGTDNGDEFIGDVDEVKFYRLALNSDQIKLEYNRGSAQLLGATSTDSTGNASWSSANEYCPPRSSGTCTPPVAEWRMDENTGNILQDSSGNGYTSSAFTGNTKYISGIFGSGLLFDGDNDVVRITPAGSSYLDTIGAVGNSYTVSGWFKTTNANTSLANTVVGKDKDNSGVFPFRLYISTSPKEIQFGIDDGSTCLASGSSIAVNDGNWHLATGVFNASTGFVYVYIDGMLIGISSSCGTNNSSANTDDISIGNARASLDGDYTNDDFEGSIDMVRIYDYARTPAEIVWEYGHGKPSVGWWKLDDNVSGNAQTIRDSASFAKDGTTANNSTNLSCTGSGKINLACDFDGTDDSISMGSGLSKLTIAVGDSRDFSITGWFNRDTITTDDTIISQRATVTNGNQGWAIWIGGTSDALTFEGCDANVNCDEYMIETTSTFTSTGWHHFALIWDDDNESNVIFYVDGKPESVTRTCNTSGSPVSCTLSNIGSLTVNTRNFRIGSLHGGTSTDMPFDGKIDDIRFYSHTLNAVEVKNIFNQGSGVRFGPESGTP